jgi:hypothetical protein
MAREFTSMPGFMIVYVRRPEGLTLLPPKATAFHFSNSHPWLVQFLLLIPPCRAPSPKLRLLLRHPGIHFSSKPSTLPKIRSVACAGVAITAAFCLTVTTLPHLRDEPLQLAKGWTPGMAPSPGPSRTRPSFPHPRRRKGRFHPQPSATA